jgi:hypothetical protein
MQALADEPQQRPIRDPNLKHLLQLAAIQAVEEGHDVRFENPLHLAPVHDLVEGPYGVMGTAPGPKSIRAAQKVLLVECFQHLTHGVLNQLILKRRNPNRPHVPLSLRDVDTPDGLMAIPLRLQPGMQSLEVGLQVVPVVLLCDPIHTHRRIRTRSAISSCQSRHIHQMRQGVEPSFGFVFRSFHYLQKSR